MIISLDLYVLPYLKWVLPYISYFDNDEKNKHFLWLRMIGYWLKIMKFGTKLKRHQTKFDSMPVYDKNYIKVKVSVFNGVVNRNFKF